jgi:phage baseplate assembly protein W
MASINFIQPKNTDVNNTFLYSDLYLDIQEQKVFSKSNEENKVKSDIRLDYDINAIKNSLNSLFNTKKGQRPLYPEWGINLEAFLFEPLNEDVAYKIGKAIQQGILQEPRVVLLNLNVIIDSDQLAYDIELHLFIPSLSINTIITGSLTDREGFSIT